MAQCIAKLLEFQLLLGVTDFDPNLVSTACRQFCLLFGALNKEASAQG